MESILAAGDVASFPLPLADGERVSIGHWQLAHYLGSVAGRTAAGKDAEVNTVPFFWTMQYGKSIRYTGEWEGGARASGGETARGADRTVVVHELDTLSAWVKIN